MQNIQAMPVQTSFSQQINSPKGSPKQANAVAAAPAGDAQNLMALLASGQQLNPQQLAQMQAMLAANQGGAA